jgi:hypothetical protein
VPKTFITFNHLAALPSGEKEPIGKRIIEVPEVLEQFANRDTHAQFIAYVPPGAVAKGEALVKNWRRQDHSMHNLSTAQT